MNKFFLSFFVTIATVGLTFAQVAGTDSNSNGIRDDVDSVISQMTSRYSLTAPQVSALVQVARSQQYILTSNISTRAQAIEVSKRDTAATNCASSRLSDSMMENLYNGIQAV